MLLKDRPIRRKLMTIILLTSGVVLLLTCAAFFAYEFLTFRQSAVRNLFTLGEIIADNSTAALAFDNQDDAREILAALKAERHIVAAGLYDKEGKLFSKYPANLPGDAFPAAPGKDGYRFERSHLVSFQPVVEGGNKRLGTLYLKSDMEAMYAQFRLYGIIAVLVIAVSFLVAYLLSRRLQQQISQPILALAETARAVSDRRDYSVRATKLGQDELGLLTDAFNHMLTQIHEQNRALTESEERLRGILNSALSAVVVIDSAGKITDWNPRAEKMFGWTRTEAVGRKLSEVIIPPQYREAHRGGLERFLATGEGPVLNRLVEVSALRRDGREFPVELSITPQKTGEAVTFCGFITDITERKRAEQRQAGQYAVTRILSEAASLAEASPRILEAICEALGWSVGSIWSVDAAARVLRCVEIWHRPSVPVPAFEAISRQSAFPPGIGLPGRVWASGNPGWIADVVKDANFPRAPFAAQDGLHGAFGFPIRCGNEVTGVIEFFSLEIQQPDEDLLKMMATIGSQIGQFTERKEAQTRLQAQLSRLDLLHRITRAIGERQDLPSIFQVIVRSLEDNLPIDFGCVCLYDPAEETLTVTSVGARSGALATELAMSEQARIALDQNGLARCVQGELVYEPDISQVPFPFPQRLAAGGLGSLVAAPLLIEGKVFGVLLAARRQTHSFGSADCEFLRQLSEHVALAAHQARLYGALQQAYHDLRQTQHTVMQQERLRALGEMASGIAHDINNAISPVTLYTESLLEREPDLSERAREYLITIQRAIEDVAQTVGRMREFYRRREAQLDLTTLDLNRVVQQVISLTRTRWSNVPQERGIVINLQTELAAGLPSLMGAENEIRDALTNLIFNAVDAMPEGGTLIVRTRAVAGGGEPDGRESAALVHLEVCDTGVGMDEETKRRCLEPFFTTKGERGTGLGLAMVYGMVQRHGAEVEIESEPGKGTTVRLIFPAAVLAATVRAARLARPAQRLRILIVDDDPLILKSLRDTLEGDGHLVSAADGGQAGIDTFAAAQSRGEPFAVVITDLGMPYVDGRKVAASIKDAAPSTPVILLTGWGQRLVAEKDVPAHVNRVLNKPPRLHELRSALAELTASVAQTGQT